MDELTPQGGPGTGPGPAGRTGVAAVDTVLEQVEALDDVPVEGHVAVFERAHEQLRRALDADADS